MADEGKSRDELLKELEELRRQVEENEPSDAARKRAEERVRRQAQLLDEVSDAIIYTDTDFNIRSWNRAAHDIYGWPADEVIGKPVHAVTDLRYPHDKMEDIVERFLMEGRWQGEVVQRRKDGTDVDVLSSVVLVRDSAGEPVGAVAVNRDISKRKRAEARFRALTENTSVYDVVDLEGNVHYVSPSVESMFGWTPEEIKTQSIFALVHPDDVSMTIAEFEELAKHPGTTRTVDIRYRHKDGSWRDIQVSCVDMSADPTVQGIVLTSHDVTDRKRAEEKLRESEEKYRVLFERESDAVFIYDPDTTNILDANAATSRMYGYDKDELVGLSCLQFSAQAEQSAASIDRTREHDQVNVPYRLHRKKDGTVFPVDVTGHKVAFGGRTVMFAVSKDITERRRAEEEKANLEEQLRQSQKMEAIGTLAGGIAHDFNNLLTGILGYSSLLKRDAEPGTKTYGACDVIEKSATRAAELTKQLLGFARQGKLRNAPVDMHRVIADTIAILGRTIDKRVAITQRLAAQTAVVKGDISQLEQVVMNLAINAGDAMPRGGDLVFETDVVDLDEEYCRHHPEFSPGTYVIVSVSDAGMGIRDEDLSRIFDPFYTTKEVGKGSGMGLSMAYGIVKNHGGHVTVETALGSGTTFKVYLPWEETRSAKPDSGEHKVIRFGTGKILVVDDEEGVRYVTSSILTSLGYDVEIAWNGRDAIDYCSERITQIDLVILDLTMPEMDGRECFYALKELDPDVKVIIATGHALDSTGQELLNAGALRFLRKPFTPGQLAEAVAKALSG